MQFSVCVSGVFVWMSTGSEVSRTTRSPVCQPGVKGQIKARVLQDLFVNLVFNDNL